MASRHHAGIQVTAGKYIYRTLRAHEAQMPLTVCKVCVGIMLCRSLLLRPDNLLHAGRKEDERFSQSKVAQQRAEARQRAEDRAVEAERNARQAAKEAFLSQR